MKSAYKDIEYTLKKSQRKTASLYIERDGQVSLLVPNHFSENQIQNLLESKRPWIYKNLAEWEDLNATRVERTYSNGEGFLYLGRSYRLRIIENQREPVLLKGGYFRLSSNNGRRTPKEMEEVLKTFYREKGSAKLKERVVYYQKKMGLMTKQVRVMELKHRWASCVPDGSLNFHWKCMMAPLTIIDYIVVHELAHLRHRNHTEAFWNEIDKVLPDYRDRKEWLRANGAGMGL